MKPGPEAYVIPADGEVIEWDQKTLLRQKALEAGPAETADERAGVRLPGTRRKRRKMAVCDQCATRFPIVRQSARFCTPRCKARWHRRWSTGKAPFGVET